MSTFTLPKYYEGTPGKDIMYHGVGKNRSSFYLGYVKQVHDNQIRRLVYFYRILGPMYNPSHEEEEPVYHAYYQWVPLMLMFQAICFYAPHFIWKQLDNGKIKVQNIFVMSCSTYKFSWS